MAEICTQCGLLHPPILPDQKCPLAKDIDSKGDVIDSSGFMSQLKNIIISKIQTKKIKDHKRLFSAIVVEIFKFLDEYRE